MRPKSKTQLLILVGLVFAITLLTRCSGEEEEDASINWSIARHWNEALLSAIRVDFPAPTVHARNLYHASAAMYDAWTAYSSSGEGVFYKNKETAENIEDARRIAISYAAYRVLIERYSHAANPTTSQTYFNEVMQRFGFEPNLTTTEGNSPIAVGNRIGNLILATALGDSANEENGYVDNTSYASVNPPMIVDYPSYRDPSTTDPFNPNRWQPLYISFFTFQNGIVSGSNLQKYVGPHWGPVTTFAMGKETQASPYSWSDIDPGAPPQLGGTGDSDYRANTVALIRYSSMLDPRKDQGLETINISPNTIGNRTLGTHNDQGYTVNPVTGEPYADNFVRRADYGRVLAEFWADGPDSETPPGHWNVLANTVSEHPSLVKKIQGQGEVVDDLQWDVKMYLALNGALHDAAVAAWGVKREYDYIRPISMIRYQGSLGQSSDPAGTSYHADGLPLEDGLIEIATTATLASGGKHRNAFINANKDHNGDFFGFISTAQMAGKVVILAWNHEPDEPTAQLSGTDWILAENWVPYQRDNFVTPAFAAYVSGHSTFSRAAAEVLSLYTGSEYFPGGLGQKTFPKNTFLKFEVGPSEELTLQWAKYYDAADEAGISRLWGGIHVPADDFKGRIMGSQVGITAFNYAKAFWD